ncbi:MAG: exodeoxyribonuclease VII large subunit [Epulopiscium sp. Nele67-Bin004]|nr:MAG: exodeoxyribonuclease VII large subunit [Epulopiscium sp. Nele67-Bin004]
MTKRVVPISDVNKYVADMLSQDFMLQNLWISGEVSGCKYYPSGHVYFTIKDEDATIKAVMFSQYVRNLSFRLEDGMKILARAKITVYDKTGSYQANVIEVEKQGIGTLYEAYEALRASLEKEGLFDNKRQVPKYPKSIGIITSKQGAALQDMLNVASRRNKNIPIYVYPASVQGQLAKAEIVRQIERANEANVASVLIVGRGGGSIEDLWSFNEEIVARAIAASKIPVISAVGHETDFTIADFVSDLRAPTPSAAMEIAMPSADEMAVQIEQYRHRAVLAMEKKISLEQNNIAYLQDRLNMLSKNRINNYWINLDYLTNMLDKLSPLKTLSRGYSYVTKDTVVTSINQVEIGDKLEITVADGTIGVSVNTKE